jgi:SOS-response transcriptional repressor LexA
MTGRKHLASLRAYWKEHRAFPGMAAMGGALGLTGSKSAAALVKRLVSTGFLKHDDGQIVPTRRFFPRPTGAPPKPKSSLPDGEEELQMRTIDDYLLDFPTRPVLCRVKNSSMKDLGLWQGDLAIVDKNRPAKPGDIVVAVVDCRMTIKTLRLDQNHKYYLEPANANWPPIHPKRSLEIVGVVIGNVRKYGS